MSLISSSATRRRSIGCSSQSSPRRPLIRSPAPSASSEKTSSFPERPASTSTSSDPTVARSGDGPTFSIWSLYWPRRSISVLGYGWTFHFGRIKNPNATGQSGSCSGDSPVYEAPDGSARVFYPVIRSNSVFVSKGFWRMRRTAPPCREQACASGRTRACATTCRVPNKPGLKLIEFGLIYATGGGYKHWTINAAGEDVLAVIVEKNGR